MPDRITFNSADGVAIVGSMHTGPSSGPAALLLHMMPAAKESWDEFASLLCEKGFSAVLAIDLRGHGESLKRGDERLDYHAFDNREHQSKLKDVEAAVAWLVRERGVDPAHLALAGASIGANLAIAYAGSHPEIRATAALSPGLDYHGVTVKAALARFTENQALFLAASRDDAYSCETNAALAALKPSAMLVEFERAGHGTRMFANEPGFMEQLASWLAENVR